MITYGRHILLGLDASLSDMGVCVYVPQSNSIKLFTGDILNAIGFINKNCRLREVVAVLEDVNLDSPLFGARKIINSAMVQHRYGKISEDQAYGKISSALKIAQHLGKSKAACDLCLKLFHKKEVPVIQVAPSSRDRVDRGKKQTMPINMCVMPTKTTAFQFKTLTGFGGVSSEHARDAATLVWGKSMAWAENMLLVQQEQKLNKKAVSTNGESIGIRNGKFVILDTVKKK